jgi:hypothetical protein
MDSILKLILKVLFRKGMLREDKRSHRLHVYPGCTSRGAFIARSLPNLARKPSSYEKVAKNWTSPPPSRATSRSHSRIHCPVPQRAPWNDMTRLCRLSCYERKQCRHKMNVSLWQLHGPAMYTGKNVSPEGPAQLQIMFTRKWCFSGLQQNQDGGHKCQLPRFIFLRATQKAYCWIFICLLEPSDPHI